MAENFCAVIVNLIKHENFLSKEGKLLISKLRNIPLDYTSHSHQIKLFSK